VVVQLPGFGPTPTVPVESGWSEIQDSQRRAVELDRHAALAVTIDLGERDDIHPIAKREVGLRIASAMRHVAYGETIPPTGPAVRSASLEPGRVVVSFRDVEGRLVTYSSAHAIGFELCAAAAGTCRFVSGTVEGDRVVIPTSGGEPPTRLRFCWGGSPMCNLSDGSGLPAGPFELALH
jgi:sialate O-acetylesterase